MARSSYYADPARKHLEIYYDFSGGLNTVTSNDNLKVSELTQLVNMDLGERGSVKRRYGMVKQAESPIEGKAQGYFRYFKEGGEFEEILAIGGKLYKNGEELAISGLEEGFQTDRQIEATQLGKFLYFATGTKLCQYDGEEAKVVEPYAPEPLEALYIGTNALADDPDNYLQDGESANLRIDGVTVTMRYGVVNKANVFEAFVSKPNESSIEYKFMYRKEGDDEWELGQDFSSERTYEFTPMETGSYQFDIYARIEGESEETKYARYILPSYKVKEIEEEQEDTSTIHTCNRILLHWSRLVLYGDTEHTQAIYVSEVNRGDYFPIPNSLNFDSKSRDPLTALVRFRDNIIAFTPSSIQALFGKHPSEYSRAILNTSIGCIAPYSAQVMGNYVSFLSREGIYILKNMGYTEDRLNIEKIDTNIANVIPKQETACGYTINNQYHICFPEERKRYRYYYEANKNQTQNPWTSDESEKMNFIRFYSFDGILYGQTEEGNVLKFDENVWDDDGYVYKDVVETKYFDFGQPYNAKKLKEIQVMLGHKSPENSNAVLWVYADGKATLNPDRSYASVNENGEIEWNTVHAPNLNLIKGTVFGQWILGKSPFGDVDSTVKKLRISGKCRRTKIRMEHEEANHNQLLGLAYVFKLKKA